MIIIGLVILIATVIGVIADSLGAGVRHVWAHRRSGRTAPGLARLPGAEAAELKDLEPSSRGASS
jgi:hypothetical protein